MKQRASSAKAKRIALSAVLGACSLAVLYLACYMPSGRLGMAAAAGLFPAAAVTSCGFGAGFLCYAGTAVLAMLLVADKNVALLYLLFFGLYPMIKGWIEKWGRLALELVMKFVIFNLYAILVFRGLSGLLTGLLPTSNLPPMILLVIANVVFFLYDYGFSKVLTFYRLRVDRVLH